MISISDAAVRLRSGELVAFPTETVYGLGANALDAAAVAKIYELKGRPATSPLIVHVASIEMARELAAQWPVEAENLARRFWPGPLTLVLPKKAPPESPAIPDIVTAGLRTVGLRMPSHAIAAELIHAAGVPLAAPSANRFTGLSPTTAQHVRDAFGDAVPVIDGGPCEVGIESTVAAIGSNGEVTLLRPGHISRAEIAEALGRRVDDIQVVSEGKPDEAHPAPGMHERHYSPRTPLKLCYTPDPNGAFLWITKPAASARTVQMPNDPVDYAAKLYSVLHDMDSQGLPVITVEPPPETLEWAAVLDRLRRAAAK